jgi:hypothetical protein
MLPEYIRVALEGVVVPDSYPFLAKNTDPSRFFGGLLIHRDVPGTYDE